MSAVSYRYEALLVPATLAGDEIRQALEAGFVQRLRFQAASASQAQRYAAHLAPEGWQVAELARLAD